MSLKAFKEVEHFILALFGLAAVLVCALTGHSDAASSLAIICLGANGGSAATRILAKQKTSKAP